MPNNKDPMEKLRRIGLGISDIVDFAAFRSDHPLAHNKTQLDPLLEQALYETLGPGKAPPSAKVLPFQKMVRREPK
jgi:hypothetical protein